MGDRIREGKGKRERGEIEGRGARKREGGYRELE